MGNTCVGPSIAKSGFFQSVSATLWRAQSPTDALPPADTADVAVEPPPAVENTAPLPVKIRKDEDDDQDDDDEEEVKKKGKETAAAVVKRVGSAGVLTGAVLKRRTENLKEVYSIGRKLGQGQFGTTYLCAEKGGGGRDYACKSILKHKLATEEDVEDVRREIQIMHHLTGHPNVIAIEGAYEDAVAVHLVMELCAGGELFDRIVQKGHYTERKAADLARIIVGVVEACHSLGVMHRDLKPENFLFVDQSEEAPLKTIDFGLSVFFRPGLQ